jgi:hypothetical protein
MFENRRKNRLGLCVLTRLEPELAAAPSPAGRQLKTIFQTTVRVYAWEFPTTTANPTVCDRPPGWGKSKSRIANFLGQTRCKTFWRERRHWHCIPLAGMLLARHEPENGVRNVAVKKTPCTHADVLGAGAWDTSEVVSRGGY